MDKSATITSRCFNDLLCSLSPDVACAWFGKQDEEEILACGRRRH